MKEHVANSNPISLADRAFEFFLIVAPGWEDLALWELKKWRPSAEVRVEKGGLTMIADLRSGCELNRCLKIPTRILIRLADFACRDFPKLFRKVSSFAWQDWLGEQDAIDSVQIVVSSHQSRLRIKRRIEDTVRDGLKAWHKKSDRRKGVSSGEANSLDPGISIFIRFDQDICTMSLDTSGDTLYKRGLRTHIGEAPIRETIAAGVLLALLRTAENRGLLAEEREWLDPMVGSGVFFMEAAHLGRKINERPFAFATFPIWSETEKSRSSADQAAKTLDTVELPLAPRAFIGIERDLKTLRAAEDNLTRRGEQAMRVQLLNQDFAQMAPLATTPKRWLVANPPYGERLKIEGPLEAYYSAFLSECERVARPELTCVIFPQKARLERMRLPRGWQLAESLRFSNGGLPVAAHIFVRRDGSVLKSP